MCLLSPGHKPVVRPSVCIGRAAYRTAQHIINGVHIETFESDVSTPSSATQPLARDNTRQHETSQRSTLNLSVYFSSSFLESTKDNPVFCYQHNDYHRRCDQKRWQKQSIFFDCCSTVCHTPYFVRNRTQKKCLYIMMISAVPLYGFVFEYYFFCHNSDPPREHNARLQSIN